jgi:photosystem II stability/assembly factor-like uncharacterized protein
MRLRFGFFFLVALTPMGAQTPASPAVIENTGKPVRIPFQCTGEDMQASALTCPPEHPCPVYLELAGLESLGSKLFLSGNLHTENATLFSILLVSSDSGKTWTEPHERIPAAGLDPFQFIDFETGWVGGQSLGTVPRDPFFLLTHDGGKTWYSRPVFSETHREGAIDAFHFDSKTHGTLWVDRSQSGETGDRYETYESLTGGESWMLREAGSQRTHKGARSGPSDWRLHTDPVTASYRVERRAGPGWEAVAAFVVHAGDCREEEPAILPEPPASSEETPEISPAPPVPGKPPAVTKSRR